ncbi:MAG: carbohydrate-binding domain-containing protein [Lepagella sp.]
MKRTGFYFAGMALLGALCASATSSYVLFNSTDGVTRGIAVEKVDSMYVADTNLVVKPHSLPMASIPLRLTGRMTIAEAEEVIAISYADGKATVLNPYAFEGVDVSVSGNFVTVTNTSEMELAITATGTGSGLKVYSPTAIKLTIDGLRLSNPYGAAINIQSKKKTALVLNGDNVLADSETYSTPDGEKENGCIFSLGNISISGSGNLSVSSLSKHAIASSKSIEQKSGTVTVTGAASDGLHADGITLSGGKLEISGTQGDGVDAGSDALLLSGTEIKVTSTAADVAGFKGDGGVTLRSGKVDVSVSGAQSKGLKSKGPVTIEGGEYTATMTGGVVVTDGDPSYCTAIKSNGVFTMTGGTVKVTSSGEAGKGISADTVAYFKGGVIDIHTTGNGAVYTDATGAKDSYSSTGITVDGDLYLLGGNITIQTDGTAGKAIKSDMAIFIGAEGTDGPVINAKTTGSKFLVSGSSGGGRPGGGPGGNNADYANPKVVKADGDLTVWSGTLTLVSTQDGGEGLESKNQLTINGGDIHVTTVDDCINATNHIQVNGGKVRCLSTGNDAIDSNGTMTFAGGTVLAAGTRSPEESFDCDQNTFIITGGNLFGIGGSCSNPTSAQCTQRVAIQSFSSITANQRISICDASGAVIMSTTNLSNITSGKLFLSSAQFVQGGTYTIYKGGTYTGGEQMHELSLGGTLTGASMVSSFTTASMVTGSGGMGGR